jgi:DivIVA domain-containing protein
VSAAAGLEEIIQNDWSGSLVSPEMADTPLDRLRNPQFAHAVRGYDRHEVDEFLAEIGDWLERGADEATSSELVRSALERVGEQTAAILTEAHDAAEAIRADAAAEVRQKLVDANATAERLAAEAEQHAERARTEADGYARRTRAEAEQESASIIATANGRKRDIEAVISDLEERREQAIAELEQIASGLTGTASQTRTRIEADSAAGEPTRPVAIENETPDGRP